MKKKRKKESLRKYLVKNNYIYDATRMDWYKELNNIKTGEKVKPQIGTWLFSITAKQIANL